MKLNSRLYTKHYSIFSEDNTRRVIQINTFIFSLIYECNTFDKKLIGAYIFYTYVDAESPKKCEPVRYGDYFELIRQADKTHELQSESLFFHPHALSMNYAVYIVYQNRNVGSSISWLWRSDRVERSLILKYLSQNTTKWDEYLRRPYQISHLLCNIFMMCRRLIQTRKWWIQHVLRKSSPA